MILLSHSMEQHRSLHCGFSVVCSFLWLDVFVCFLWHNLIWSICSEWKNNREKLSTETESYMSCGTALMLPAFVSSLLETILSDMNRADIILSVLTVTCAQCAHFPRVRTQVYYGTDFTAVNILFDFITIVLGFWENDKNDKKLTPNEIILKHNIYLSSTHFSSTTDLPSLFSSPICSICPHTSVPTHAHLSLLYRGGASSRFHLPVSKPGNYHVVTRLQTCVTVTYGRGWKIFSTHSVEVLLQFQWVVYSLC